MTHKPLTTWPPAPVTGHLHQSPATCTSHRPPAPALGHLHQPSATCTSPRPPAPALGHLASKANKNQDTKTTHSHPVFSQARPMSPPPSHRISPRAHSLPNTTVSNPTKTSRQPPWGTPHRPSKFQFRPGVHPTARSKMKSPRHPAQPAGRPAHPLSQAPPSEGAASSAQTKSTRWA